MSWASSLNSWKRYKRPGRGLIPLMLQMQADLEQLVQEDIPLRKEDRLARVEQLKVTLARADVSEAEKFRQLLQAYQIEAEYGSRMDAYPAQLALDGAERRVDVLALGRVSPAGHDSRSLPGMALVRPRARAGCRWIASGSPPLPMRWTWRPTRKSRNCCMCPCLSPVARRLSHEMVPPSDHPLPLLPAGPCQ